MNTRSRIRNWMTIDADPDPHKKNYISSCTLVQHGIPPGGGSGRGGGEQEGTLDCSAVQPGTGWPLPATRGEIGSPGTYEGHSNVRWFLEHSIKLGFPVLY
jgi:hypothetical protein